MDLEAGLKKALRVIDEGKVPKVVIIDPHEEDEYASEHEEAAAADVLAPPPLPPQPLVAFQHVPSPPMPVTAQDTIHGLAAMTPAHQHEHRSRAVQAELLFNEMRPKIASEIDKRVLAATDMSGARIYQALLAFKKLREWSIADADARVAGRQRRFEDALRTIHAAVAADKQKHRASIQTHITEWKTIVDRYIHVLDSAAELLNDMIAAEEKSVAKESTRVALALTNAIQSILKKTIADVDALTDPTDAMHAMSVLRHAIDDSAKEIQMVVKDQLGIRPSFDPTRNRELEDFLTKTKADIARSETALAATQASLHRSGLTPDDEFAYKQNAATLETNLQAAREYEKKIETDLKQAQVQKIVSKLHAVCAQQAQWQEASTALAAACAKKDAVIQAAYTDYARHETVEGMVCEKDCEALRALAEATRVHKRRDLDTLVKAELLAFDRAMESVKRAHVLIMPHLVDAAKDYLFSRVLLEYSQLT